MRGNERRRISPRRKLPASTATSMKYGNEEREMRRVPSRSAAMEWRFEEEVSHFSMDGKRAAEAAAVIPIMCLCEQ